MNTNYGIDKFIGNLKTPEELDSAMDTILKKRKLADYAEVKDKRTAIKLLADYKDEAKELIENEGKVLGLESGFKTIDDLTKGFKAGDLIVLAGQPSHGKTVFGNNIAYRVAKAGTPVLFVSLEMTQARIEARIENIAQSDNGDSEHEPFLYTQEVSSLTGDDMPMLIKKAIEDCGVQLVIIDHLHFLADRSARDMRMEVGTITQNLKRLAVSAKIPIILLAQLSRIADASLKPGNHHLKESGYIEQDADIILMIWRDISPESTDTNSVEIYCTKNRDFGFGEHRFKYFHQKGSALYEDSFHAVDNLPDNKLDI